MLRSADSNEQSSMAEERFEEDSSLFSLAEKQSEPPTEQF